MDLPKISLDGMKSKLGFASEDTGYERRSSRRNDYVDDYDDGYDDGYDTSDDGVGYRSTYEPYNQVTTRASGSRRSSVSSPRLVSADDVRASTRLASAERMSASSSSSSYRPARSSYSSSSSSSFRTLVEGSQPAPTSPSAVAARKSQSEGLNSLFGDTTVPAMSAASTPPLSGLAPRTQVSAKLDLPTTADSSYDPYESYTGSNTTQIHTPSRSLEIFRPKEYNDVERVAKILRAGDVAIIALGETPEDLAKRVLDFSFGVASALDATVDSAAPKVFVITTGSALSEAERMRLRSQGVI